MSNVCFRIQEIRCRNLPRESLCLSLCVNFAFLSSCSLDISSTNMSCQHAGCSLEIFTTCPNHCTQNLCLAHVIEHGDIFVRNFTKTLDHLDKTTCTLIEEANIAATEVNEMWTLHHHCSLLTDILLVDQTSSV